MLDFDSVINASLGGILIGLASLLLLLTIGRIAGISGIVGSWLAAPARTGWRSAFVLGLLLAGVGMSLMQPALFASELDQAPFRVIVAGLFVGFGSRLGSGCTSGHGVCGIGRLSPRSIIATITFMATGVASVACIRMLMGDGS